MQEMHGKYLLNRLVHKALEEEMKTIHALTLRTILPAEWRPEESSHIQ